jgi:hypothetical protein
MSREEMLETLERIRQDLHKQFEDRPGTHAARLTQLDHAIGNAAAVTQHLFDEEAREVELAVRVMADEATSPVAGRTKKDHYAVVARRAK